MLNLDAASDVLEESSERELTWHGEPVFIHRGPVSELAPLIPRFERRPFGTTGSAGSAEQLLLREFHPSGENRLRDVIVRMPLDDKEQPTPVGIVSKRYNLVQHTELFQKMCDAISKAEITAKECDGELRVSAYGARLSMVTTRV
jgi:hypothetical protein